MLKLYQGFKIGEGKNNEQDCLQHILYDETHRLLFEVFQRIRSTVFEKMRRYNKDQEMTLHISIGIMKTN